MRKIGSLPDQLRIGKPNALNGLGRLDKGGDLEDMAVWLCFPAATMKRYRGRYGGLISEEDRVFNLSKI
jgi:hypothetical protein